MFKFGGWKASLNFSGPSRRKEVYENGPELSVGGAYRTHREEFFGRNSIWEPPKKLTPSMVKLPPSNDKLKTSKSANDISDPHSLSLQLRKSANDVSTDPRGGTSSNRNSSALHKNDKHKSTKDDKKNEKEQKSEEKKRLAEQKKQEKLATQEQAKKDKLRIQQEKKIAQQQAKDVKLRKGKQKKAPQLPQASVTKALVPQAPVPPPQPAVPPPRAVPSQPAVSPQPAARANPMAYSTNTLESSISRTSGPPPYSETPVKQPNNKDNTGNTSFSKPIENSSWDMISEHRNQISRNHPAPSGGSGKQVVMDLQFSFDRAQAVDTNNSEV